MRKFQFILAAVLLAASGWAMAHGGGLNADGCHTNRKTGDYHCHRQQVPKQNATQPQVQNNLHQSSQSDSSVQRKTALNTSATGPTCYTGPRGGRYTITPSGRKNYNGC